MVRMLAARAAVASAVLLLAACGDSDSGEADIPGIVDDLRASVVSITHPFGEGSGVVWDDDGHIVTNNHVVEGAEDIEVVLASGERLPAEVVGTDPLTDLAVLEVDREDLTAAEFDEDLPDVGTLVLAIGNPLGFEGSVTAGIISGVHRSIPSGGTTPALVDLLQTDAAISPGNSGGALVDRDGEVVGINVAYIPPEASAVSLGFAIPSATVVSVVEQLLDEGTVEHAFVGIEPRALTPAVADELGLEVERGVFVFSLTPDGPAEAAGLQPGDVITRFGDDEIASIEDLFGALRSHSPGDEVEVRYVRGDDEETAEIELDDRPG